MRCLTLAGLALLAGCAHTATPPPEPEVRTVEVKVPTPVPCKALAKLGPEPDYVDTNEAINAAANIPEVGKRAAELARLYAKGRLQRIQRLSEYVVAKSSCLF